MHDFEEPFAEEPIADEQVIEEQVAGETVTDKPAVDEAVSGEAAGILFRSLLSKGNRQHAQKHGCQEKGYQRCIRDFQLRMQ